MSMKTIIPPEKTYEGVYLNKKDSLCYVQKAINPDYVEVLSTDSPKQLMTYEDFYFSDLRKVEKGMVSLGKDYSWIKGECYLVVEGKLFGVFPSTEEGFMVLYLIEDRIKLPNKKIEKVDIKLCLPSGPIYHKKLITGIDPINLQCMVKDHYVEIHSNTKRIS